MSESECPACGSTEHSDCCGAGIEPGEMCLFPNMPWIHDHLGSQLEHELTTRKAEMGAAEYEPKLKLRLAIGKHDLRRRGFD